MMEDEFLQDNVPLTCKCVYIEKFISGVTGLITMLLCYKAGKKNPRRKFGRSD